MHDKDNLNASSFENEIVFVQLFSHDAAKTIIISPVNIGTCKLAVKIADSQKSCCHSEPERMSNQILSEICVLCVVGDCVIRVANFQNN